ncbi:izumo sperm-egg fusion protein 3 [Pelobates fuscus]|uniref:izumo sperm-egg fusion protein 3 n=1 Tax=Pelobates fuscus TaxID=191477 RepID=UPI002FE4C94C
MAGVFLQDIVRFPAGYEELSSQSLDAGRLEKLKTLVFHYLKDMGEFRALTEEALLDSWTCLRIRAKCLDGPVCGVEDYHEEEKRDLDLYLAFVVLSVLLFSISIMSYIFIYHKTKVEDRIILWKLRIYK